MRTTDGPARPSPRGPPTTPAPMPPTHGSPRMALRVSPMPSPRDSALSPVPSPRESALGSSPPTSPRMATLSSPRGRSPPVPRRNSPPASPRDDDPLRAKPLEGSRTLGRNTPASVQRSRLAEVPGDCSSERLPHVRPRLSEGVMRSIPTAPLVGETDTSSPMGSMMDGERLSFADSAEFVNSEDFTGERDLEQLLQEPDAAPPLPTPTHKKMSPATVRWKTVRPSASVLSALKLVLSCDEESFERHAQEEQADGDASATRTRSETRPEILSALRALEEQIFDEADAEKLQQSIVYAIDEHIRESGTSGDTASRSAQLELLRGRVSTLRQQHKASTVRYTRQAFSPLPPSVDDTQWM